MASTVFSQFSGNLTERADHWTFRGIVEVECGRIFLGRGGVPIIQYGAIIGGCGVGGTGQQDKDYAQVAGGGLQAYSARRYIPRQIA